MLTWANDLALGMVNANAYAYADPGDWDEVWVDFPPSSPPGAALAQARDGEHEAYSLAYMDALRPDGGSLGFRDYARGVAGVYTLSQVQFCRLFSVEGSGSINIPLALAGYVDGFDDCDTYLHFDAFVRNEDGSFYEPLLDRNYGGTTWSPFNELFVWNAELAPGTYALEVYTYGQSLCGIEDGSGQAATEINVRYGDMVPEPSTVMLLGAGLLSAAGVIWRRRRR